MGATRAFDENTPATTPTVARRIVPGGGRAAVGAAVVAVTVLAVTVAAAATGFADSGTAPSRTGSVTKPSVTAPTGRPVTPVGMTRVAAARVPTSVPSRAFLQPADTRYPEAGSNAPRSGRLPSLCGARFASDALIRVTATKHIIFYNRATPPHHVPDGSVEQTITVYRGNGAKKFMTRLRAAVAACPQQTVNGKKRQYRSLAPVRVGNDSIMIRERYQAGAYDGGKKVVWLTDRISAVRIGDTVTILNATGWENINVSAATSTDLTRAAHRRVAAWR